MKTQFFKIYDMQQNDCLQGNWYLMHVLEKKEKRKEEIFKINNITFHVKKLEKKK